MNKFIHSIRYKNKYKVLNNEGHLPILRINCYNLTVINKRKKTFKNVTIQT